MKVLARVDLALGWASRALMALAGILLIFLMFAVVWEVALRYFVGRPTSWVIEISGYILVFIPFLVGAWILRNEGHVKMDLLLNALPPSAQYIVNVLTSILGSVACFILTYAAIRYVINLVETNSRTPTPLMLPRAPIASVVVISSLLMAVEFLFRCLRNAEQWRMSRSNVEAIDFELSVEIPPHEQGV
ncbi:MAG: TRAP transporter small permease subunit [Thermoleophilia bacterium]